MKNKLLTLAAGLTLLAVVGKFYAQPVMAQVRAALVQDVDQPARAPFQVTVTVNPVANFNYTQVAIPAGKRLVIDYVSISGAAFSNSGAIQPIVILNSTLGGGQNSLYYLAPPANASLPTQYYMAQPTTIYADTLYVGPAFAGFTPTFDVMSVVISGHLITP